MAKQRSVFWQIYPTVLVLLLVFLLVVYALLSDIVNKSYLEQKKEDLKIQAALIENEISPLLQQPFDPQAIDRICKTLGQKIPTRITIISPDGKVWGESEKDPAQMENHLSRPEIQQALQGSVGTDIRPSSTLGESFLYVATAYRHNGQIAFFIRAAISLQDLRKVLSELRHRMFVAAILAAGLLAGLMGLVCWRWSRPLRQMEETANRFAQGDLQARIPIPQTRELATLAKTINKMAAELTKRLDTITAQRNEQQAVLASMSEGVLAIDCQNRCISMNNTACRILQTSIPNPIGRTIPEIIRNTTFQEFIEQALNSSTPLEKRLSIQETEGERHLQVRCSALLNNAGTRIGSLIVFNDITELYKLQNIKSDFVANVSHELKTPVTSIKGFIETLLEGAKDNPQDLQRFLEIMKRQTERLHSIIEDLLTLSAVEQQVEESSIPLEKTSVLPLLQEAVECCRHLAEAKKISLHISCQPDLTASLNPSLFIQALFNLIDNAVKYSGENQCVQIRAFADNQQIRIEVQDFGCGIAREHLPRLFERFYRADKARSRSLGGTGLGLAIVKHIVQAHNGSIQVHSVLGKGSTFTILLPIIS